MDAKRRTETLVGAGLGLCVAAAAVALAWLDGGRGHVLRGIANFLASLPVLAVWVLNGPEALAFIFHFVYWAAVGGTLGWLGGRRGGAHRVAALVLVLGLAASHWAAGVKLGREIEAAIRAVVMGLVGEGR